MEVESIYVIERSKFGKAIEDWCEGSHNHIIVIDPKDNDWTELVEGVVLFHENHNFSKENLDIYSLLNKDNKVVYRVDINGTLSATRSNFDMWLERNRPSSLLFLGGDEIIKNSNLFKFLEAIRESQV